MPSFDNPKSVSNACPSISNTMLSGFKSLNIISLLCKSSSASMISDKYNLALSSENLLSFYKALLIFPPGA